MGFDLNVPWPVDNYDSKPSNKQLIVLKGTISTLYVLGYNYIGINFILQENARIPNNPKEINPIEIKELKEQFKRDFPELRLYTRLTLTFNEPSQCQGLSKVRSLFDIVAVRPTSEKALQLVAGGLDVDLISLNMSSRLPFYLKHKTVGSAVDKGIKFEICYSQMVSGPAGYSTLNDSNGLSSTASMARKSFLNNVIQLIRASRSRGLVVSSGATQPLQVRNAHDILNFLQTVGLDRSKSKSCISTNPERALVSGRLRVTSYNQTVVAEDGTNKRDMLYNNERENPSHKSDANVYKKRLVDTSSGQLLKKQRNK